ncbi:MAG: hypothetical protein ACRDOO_24370 [Actinomadura sp.]
MLGILAEDLGVAVTIGNRSKSIRRGTLREKRAWHGEATTRRQPSKGFVQIATNAIRAQGDAMIPVSSAEKNTPASGPNSGAILPSLTVS